MKKGVAILIICGILLPNFSLVFAEIINPPETLDEAKNILEKLIDIIAKNLPDVLKKIWKEDVLPIWQKMWSWFKIHIWEPYLLPFYKDKIEPLIKSEIEKRKPIIGEEFQKEKKEMKEDFPNAKAYFLNLWEKFKELLK